MLLPPLGYVEMLRHDGLSDDVCVWHEYRKVAPHR